MLRTLLSNAAFSFNDIERLIEGDQKETPLEILCGKTTRFAMQTIGTEWGRSTIGDNIWTNIAISKAAGLGDVVITDVRFPNEVEAVKTAGGTVIKIVRSEQPLYLDGADGHSSEALTDSIMGDHLVINNSTIEDLQKKVLAIAEKI